MDATIATPETVRRGPGRPSKDGDRRSTRELHAALREQAAIWGDDWLFRIHCPRASIERMPRTDIIRVLHEAAAFRKALSADGNGRSVIQWQRLFRDAVMFFGGEWLRTTMGAYRVNRISDLSRDSCVEALTQAAKGIAAKAALETAAT